MNGARWTEPEIDVLREFIDKPLAPGEIWDLVARLPGRTSGTIQGNLSKLRAAAGLRFNPGQCGAREAHARDAAQASGRLAAAERRLRDRDG